MKRSIIVGHHKKMQQQQIAKGRPKKFLEAIEEAEGKVKDGAPKKEKSAQQQQAEAA